MKRLVLSTLLIFGFLSTIFAQPDPDLTLITIAGRDISVGEFDRIYRKNNNDNVTQKQTVEEYLDMFINFKLKVIEAEELGMDTTSTFLDEFNSYKKQLAQPYLTNPELTEKYSLEAYERMNEEINASHIMVRLNENPLPEDTLKAFEKLMEIRSKVLAGEDFETLARATSDDPSAKTTGGNLGWFSVFRMVYNFETVAYNTEVGDVSMPFRTRFGMHILKIHDKRPALGAIKIAHIFVRAPESMTKEEAATAIEKTFAIIDSLKNGVDFGELAKRNSDDRSSAGSGGEIPWIGSGQMIKAFDDAAFALENPGDISEAVKSSFGWHIIKLLDKRPVGSYETEKPGILNKMKTGERSNLSKDAFLVSLKNEYNYQKNQEVFEKFLNRVDSSLYQGTWTKAKIKDIKAEVLFTCGDMTVLVDEFADFILKKVKKQGVTDPRVLTDIYFSDFEKEKILAYEEDNLVNKYDDYKHILQEYHDGILLFDLTDKTIWSKAVQDSTGLEEFYNKNKENYKWGERAEAYIVTVKDSAKIGDVRKYAAKRFKRKKFSSDDLLKEFCSNDTLNNCIEISVDLYEKEDNQYVDATGWKKGLGSIYYANDLPSFVIISKIHAPAVKDLSDTRGQATADYQKFLEDKWLDELREKYDYEVNMDLLIQIKDQ